MPCTLRYFKCYKAKCLLDKTDVKSFLTLLVKFIILFK